MIENKSKMSIKSLTFLTGMLVFLAPLFMNQYKEIFELGAAVTGIVMLTVLFWGLPGSVKTGYLYGTYVALATLFVAIYLVPFPDVIHWNELPGRSLYADVANFISAQGVEIAYPSLSLIPGNTQRALFYLVPVLALFLVVMSLPRRSVKTLVSVFLVVVFFESALGIIQYASGSDAFYLGNKEHGNTASGTYRNRDHFVALLEMALPLAIGIMVAPFISRSDSDERKRDRESVLSSTLTLSLVIILMLLASFFSASRAGIGLVVLGLMLSAFIFAYYVGKIKSLGFLLIASIVGMGVAFNVGIIPILNRFASDPMEDERWRIFENSQRLISEMFPWGSGPGTFPQVYRAFQPIEQPHFVNHAHNDYIELISDMGVFGVLIIAGFAVLYLARWVSLLRSQRHGTFKSLQIGAGIGIFLLLLHSYVDFNLHQMANALIFVFLAAIFFHVNRDKQGY